MRRALSAILFAAAGALAIQAQTAAQPARIERPFPAGGVIRLDLSAGAYRIQGEAADAIVVRWRTRNPEDARRVRATVEVRDKKAFVTTDGPHNGFEVDIAVPARSDLDLDLSAGELRVRDIVGSKTVDVWAGEVTIDVGEADAYRHVEARVRFGELDARPFNVTKGGVFRSFTWEGRGGYDLRARLFAGEIRLLR
jgi:phage baseplate assembly protein gpV